MCFVIRASSLIALLLAVGCEKKTDIQPPVLEQGTGWRGDGSGEFHDADPPIAWAADRNVIWRTPLPAWSNASPVVVGDRVFVCAEPSTLMCLDTADGKILWQRTNDYLDLLSSEERPRVEAQIAVAEDVRRELQKAEQSLRRHNNETKDTRDAPATTARRAELEAKIAELTGRMGPALEYRLPPTQVHINGYTTPTPVADSDHVYAFFGNGVAACYDHAGQRRWARIVEKPTEDFGQSSSPLLIGGKLLLLVNALHALDAATGQTLWTAPAHQRWGTPIAIRIGSEPAIATPGGEIIRLDDGLVLTTKSRKLAEASPVVDEETLYFIDKEAHALQFTPSKTRDKVKRDSLWEAAFSGARYFASPIVHDGHVWSVSRDGDLAVQDAATGRIVHQRKLTVGAKATFYPSLSLAGGMIFVTADDGTTHVLRADATATALATNSLAPIRSSLVFTGTRLYARTLDALYCIGK